MPGVFISYRREDSSAYAGRLYDRLSTHFGKDNVFMDVDSIELGFDFIEVLERTISTCDAVVVVIGKQWLTVTDSDGQRRLDDPEDLVRVEVAAALERKVRVVPALVAGARMPRSQELPQAIALLSRRNALEISDTAFHQSVKRLIEVLDKTPKPQPEPAPQPATPNPQPAPVPKKPYAGISRWRRALLLYRPRGSAGWVFMGWLFRIGTLHSAGFLCLMAGIGFNDHYARSHATFWEFLASFIAGTLLLRSLTSRIDKRAARKKAVAQSSSQVTAPN